MTICLKDYYFCNELLLHLWQKLVYCVCLFMNSIFNSINFYVEYSYNIYFNIFVCNSSICRKIWINWFFYSLWVWFPSFFILLEIFHWMPNTVNLSLLGDRWFYSLTNILEFFPGAPLSYLKVVWFFRSYIHDLLGGTRTAFHRGLIVPHYWSKTPLSSLSHVLQIRLSSKADGYGWILHPSVRNRNCSL